MIYVDPDAQVYNGKFVIVRQEDSREATFKQYIEEDGEATICGVIFFKGKRV